MFVYCSTTSFKCAVDVFCHILFAKLNSVVYHGFLPDPEVFRIASVILSSLHDVKADLYVGVPSIPFFRIPRHATRLRGDLILDWLHHTTS